MINGNIELDCPDLQLRFDQSVESDVPRSMIQLIYAIVSDCERLWYVMIVAS